MVSQKRTKIVIVGTGGCGRDALWTLLACNKNSKKYDILGFLDDDKRLHNKIICGKKVLGGTEWFSENMAKTTKCIVAIGSGRVRKKIVNELEKKHVKFVTVIHPSVIMSESVKIGKGTIIQAGTIISVDVEIGSHCVINMDCTIAHDTKINDFVDLNPGVHISGVSKIHTGAFVGSGVTTMATISIGKWSVIGAGSVLIEDVPDRLACIGNPGRLIKKLADDYMPYH